VIGDGRMWIVSVDGTVADAGSAYCVPESR
jgi:hypothetical protein